MAAASPPTALYEPSPEGIAVITINRPKSRNAVNADTARLLAEAFQQFDKDDTQKVCVFTGAGGEAFCAGYDLHEVAASSSSDSNIGPNAFSRVRRVTTTNPRDPLEGILGPSEHKDFLFTIFLLDDPECIASQGMHHGR